MYSLDRLVEKVNNQIKDSPIFYITADYERALGLERLLRNYHIVSLYNKDLNLLRHNNINVFSIDKNDIKATEIIQNESVIEHIRDNSENQPYIQTFKNSERFESRVLNIGATLLNDTYINNIKFERKIDQYNELIKYKVNFPETYIVVLGEVNYEELTRKFGKEFVLQFNLGHTGSGTYFIKDSKEYESLQLKFPKRIARISKKIVGNTYTVNGCIYNRNVYFSGLSLQITGIEPYANTSSATIGNDWVYARTKLQNSKESILNHLMKVGNALSENNYRGLFGIDFIVDRNNEIFIIEVNARQPASIPMNTKLQLMKGQIPLSLLHLAEFLEIYEDINNEDYNNECLFTDIGSQLFIRYGKVKKLKLNNISTGSYTLTKLGELNKIRNAYSIEDVSVEEFILLNKYKDNFENGDEIARIQQYGTTINSSKALNEKTNLILGNLVEI